MLKNNNQHKKPLIKSLLINPFFIKNTKAFSLIEMMVVVVISAVILSGMLSIIALSLRNQSHIERKATRLDLINYYKQKLKTQKIINFTTENISANTNTTLRDHVFGLLNPALAASTSASLDATPLPLYGGASNTYSTAILASAGLGINVYQEAASSSAANKILIPRAGLFLNNNGGVCTPVCTSSTGRWKVWVQWIPTVGNGAYDFYLRIDYLNSNNTSPLRSYARLTSRSEASGGGTNPCVITREDGNLLTSIGCDSTGNTVDNTISTAINNNFIGNNAGSSNTTGSNNNFIGTLAGQSNTGSDNIIMGTEAGEIGSGRQNNFIGFRAGKEVGNGEANNFIGVEAGHMANRSGSRNNFIGYHAGYGFRTNLYGPRANDNNAIGTGAGKNATNSYYNNFIGVGAGKDSTRMRSNNFIGVGAGKDSTNTNSNNYIGYYAGERTFGFRNNFIGYHAGSNTLGAFNNAIGAYAGEDTVNGSRSNNYIGEWTGRTSGGSFNNYIGHGSGIGSRGDKNVYIGYRSGKNTSGNDNIHLGTNGRHTANIEERGSHNIVLGPNAINFDVAGASLKEKDFSVAKFFSGTTNFLSNLLGNKNQCLNKQSDVLNLAKNRLQTKVKSTNNSLANLDLQDSELANLDLDSEQDNKQLLSCFKEKTKYEYNNVLIISNGVESVSAASIKDFDLNIANTITGSTDKNNRHININGKLGVDSFESKTLILSPLILGKSLKVDKIKTQEIKTKNIKSEKIIAKIVTVDRLVASNFRSTQLLASSATPLCRSSDGSLANCASSRQFKHDIQKLSSKEESEVLKQISQTPLSFYYHNQDKKEHKRMGLIAEELPEFLKIYEHSDANFNADSDKVSHKGLNANSDKVSHKGLNAKNNTYPTPDWFSIKGYLWAGVKALHSLHNQIVVKVDGLIQKVSKLITKFNKLQKTMFSNTKKVGYLETKVSKIEKILFQQKNLIEKQAKIIKNLNKKL